MYVIIMRDDDVIEERGPCERVFNFLFPEVMILARAHLVEDETLHIVLFNK